METETVDFESVKQRQRAAWAAGDYPRVGNTLQIIAERLVAAADLRAGQRALDVACGQGNAAIAAARRFADATGVDYVPAMLAQGRERAAAEHLPVRFVEGDAEDLPCADGDFDLTMSTVGVMFAPNQPRAAGEVVRVTRAGGRVALANWTPEGLVGAMFRVVAGYAPPPPGIVSPMLWGTADRLAELFGERVEWMSVRRRTYDFCYRSPAHFAEWFCAYYGPITTLVGRLDQEARARFAAELAEVPTAFNRAEDGTVLAAGEYLEAIGVRR